MVSGESVNLAILDRNEVVYIEHIDSNQTLRTFTAIGNRAPLYCTGVGKVFLAYMNKNDLQFLTHQPFTGYTDNTITDFTELTKELSSIQREGVAIDNGEMDTRCQVHRCTNKKFRRQGHGVHKHIRSLYSA